MNELEKILELEDFLKEKDLTKVNLVTLHSIAYYEKSRLQEEYEVATNNRQYALRETTGEHILKYDDILNRVTKRIHTEDHAVLNGKNVQMCKDLANMGAIYRLK